MRGGRYYDFGTGPKPSSRWAFTNRRPCGHSGLVRAEKVEVMGCDIHATFCRTEIDDMNEARYAQMAVRMADALLAELAKEQSK